MDWQKIKDEIYSEDGSLRDIYVFNTTREDWKRWVDHVNNNYKTSIHTYDKEIYHDSIEFEIIENYWNGLYDFCSTASVCLNNINVKAHFFSEHEIENDILPNEITSLNDHHKVIDYMKELSKILDKPVLLTRENMREVILIEIYKDEVILFPKGKSPTS